MTIRSPRLLVVDDNDDNRFTLTLLLEVEGFSDIAVAEDGVHALEKLDAESFDLVLLDVMMPRLNGYQVLEQLKAKGRLGDPPVIMITALNELDSTVRCIELGAEDYLPKPFNPVLLKARIRASLEKKRMRDEIRIHRDRMEMELQDARALQLGLCPSSFPPPTVERPFDVAAVMEPAREVGGDLYDVFERRDGSLCFVVGDVSGKGAPAALFMARTKDIVRLVGDAPSDRTGTLREPGEILGRANDLLCAANGSFMFVTLFVGVLGPGSSTLRYSSAGHNDPYRTSRDGCFGIVTTAKGRPLGIRKSSHYATEHLSVRTGDALFIFTDGITEATDATGGFFSEERLETCLRAHNTSSASEIVEGVMNAVRKFAAGTAQSDDITALAIRLV
ncbi:MAG: PP2C family protein-serine/threonine phosphatase [Pirellulales bacterium]